MQLEGHLTIPMSQVCDVLAMNLRNDPELAWGWHCNIAVPIQDEGIDHETANKAAARIMYNLFKIDIRTNKCYIECMKQYE